MKASTFVKTETKELKEKISHINNSYKLNLISRETWIYETLKSYREFVEQINKHIK